MTTMTLSMAASVKVNPSNQKVTLSANGTTVTLPITDPKVDFGELAPNWVEVPRPGVALPAFTVKGPRQLHTLNLNVTLVNLSNMVAEIDDVLASIYDIVQAPQITLSYGSFESSQRITTNQFVCTSFQPVITMRDPTTNNAIQGTARITLKEANPPPVFTG